MKAAEVRIGQLFEDRKGNVFKAWKREYRGVLTAIGVKGPLADMKCYDGNPPTCSMPKNTVVKIVQPQEGFKHLDFKTPFRG